MHSINTLMEKQKKCKLLNKFHPLLPSISLYIEDDVCGFLESFMPYSSESASMYNWT